MEAHKPAAKYALSSFYSSRALSHNPDDRKRKITDKNVPNALLQAPEFAEDSAMYRDLLQMERKLDWTMTRKRVEVHDALQRIIPVSFRRCYGYVFRWCSKEWPLCMRERDRVMAEMSCKETQFQWSRTANPPCLMVSCVRLCHARTSHATARLVDR